MLLSDKEQNREINGRDPPAPKDTVVDASLGMPLFWQERKTPALWKRLLGDVRGKAVFDITPGSGALARACMSLRISTAGRADMRRALLLRRESRDLSAR